MAYVAELQAKDEKMTFPALIASLSPHTNDSLTVLTNLVQQLGPPPGGVTNIDIMHFVAPARAQIAWQLREPSWAVAPGGAARATWVDVGSRVTSMAVPLAALRATMKNPAPNAGPRTNYFEAPTPFRAVRSAAHWLAAETLWNLHNDRYSEALADLEAVAALANLHREEYSLVSQMTRAGVAKVGLRLTWEALQTKRWSGEDLLRLQNCWGGCDFLELAERGMVGERCMGQESSNLMKQTNPSFADSVYAKQFLDADLLCQLRHVQAYVEQVRCMRVNKCWSKLSDALDELDGRIDALANSPTRLRYLFTGIATPHFKAAVWKSVQLETERRLATTAIALERYQRAHGQFPPSLDRLAPGFLASVPRDCINQQPLGYRLRDLDTFILYSVGEDGRDQGGDATLAKPNGNLGLWEGRDAVWPSAAK